MELAVPAPEPPAAPAPRLGARPALAALWGAAAAFAAARLLAEPALPGRNASWVEVATIPFYALAGAAALRRALGHLGREAWGWRAVALAWLLSAAGYGLMVLTSGDPLGWGAEIAVDLYTAYYPLMAAGLVLLAPRPAGWPRRVRALLDVALALGATLLLAWWFLLRDGGPGAALQHLRSGLTTTLGELLVLGSAAWLLSATDEPAPSQRLLGAGVLAATLADLAAVHFNMGGALAASRFSDVALVVSAALVASAGLARGAPSTRRSRPLGLLTGALGHVPTLAVLAVLGLLVVSAFDAGGAWPAVALGTAATTVLALLGLALARRELVDDAAERALQAERLAGAQRLATVGHLAGAAAHDFSHLAMAMGELAAELREGAPGPAAAGELEALSRRAATLCRRLLGMARGAGEAAPTPHDVAAAVAGLVPLLRRLTPMRVRVEAAPGPAAWAVVDPAQLELALVNLAVNARDAISGEGTITLSAAEVEAAEHAALRAGGVPPGRWVVISVADTGAGMDAATLARASEPFFTTKPPGEGTGLGLSLVQAMAAAAGGRVLLDSAPGRGTTARLVLPARRPAPA